MPPEDLSSMFLPTGDPEMPSGPGSPYEPESYNYTLQYPLSSAPFVEGGDDAYTHTTGTCNRKQCQNLEFQCRVYAYQVKDLRQQRAVLERQLLETKAELLVFQRQQGTTASTSENPVRAPAPAPAPAPVRAPVPARARARAPAPVPVPVPAPTPVAPNLPILQEGERYTEQHFTLEQRMALFWEEDYWIAHRRKWKKRSAHPQGDKLGFLVDIRGEKIPIGRLRMIAAYQADVFYEIAWTLDNDAPETWVREASEEIKDFHRRRMAQKFEEFRLCENDWKADRFAKLKYGEWVRGPGHLPFPKGSRQGPSSAPAEPTPNPSKSKSRPRAQPKKNNSLQQSVRTSRPSAQARQSPDPNAGSRGPSAPQEQEDDPSDSDHNGGITGTMSPLTEDLSQEEQDELDSGPDITDAEDETMQFNGSSNHGESMLPPDDDDQELQSPQPEDLNQDSVHSALDQSEEDVNESVGVRLRSAKRKAPADIYIASSPFKSSAAGGPSRSRVTSRIAEGSNSKVSDRAMRVRGGQREGMRRPATEEDIHDHPSSSREGLPSEWDRNHTRSKDLARKKRMESNSSASNADFAKDLDNNTDTTERLIDPRTRSALGQLKRNRSPAEDSEDEHAGEWTRSKRNTRSAATRSMATTERKK